MRDLINLIEELLDFSLPPSEKPLEVIGFKGLTFKKQPNRFLVGGKIYHEMFYYVWKDDEVIGGFSVEEKDDCLTIHPELYEKYQRKGYGTIIYEFAELLAKKSGKILKPSDVQSSAAVALWKKKEQPKPRRWWSFWAAKL